jgi:PPOX class probable F420-dependent enzyme
MPLTDQQLAFLANTHSAAMITLRKDGTPHAVRVGVALVDGKIWSSGVPSRLRTGHLRRDPRSTLFVFDTSFNFLTIEATVTIHDGPDAAEMNLRLFQQMQQSVARPEGTLLWYGQPKSLDDFLQTMKDEQRLIYEFAPTRAYGLSA